MQHPTTQPDSPFNLLLRDLQAFRDATHTDMALRNRHSRRALISRQAKENRRLAKAAPPAPVAVAAPPDFDRIARQQQALEKSMQATAARAKQNAVRDCLAGLDADAKAGRLTAHDAALLDVYRGRALALGVTP